VLASSFAAGKKGKERTLGQIQPIVKKYMIKRND